MTDDSVVSGGDKIIVGDISGSVAAIGAGAQVIYNNVERALSSVEEAEQAVEFGGRRLAEALTAYVRSLQRRTDKLDEQTPPATPYKALLSYDFGDAAVFYGRSEATASLLSRIERSPLTVLHADSGAGKTSLLRAGIMPRMLANGDVPLYVRPYRTAGHVAIKRALLPQVDYAPSLAEAPLHDFFRQAAHLLGGQRIVVLLDQLEELFTVQSPETRAAFVEELSPCIDDGLLPVRWLFSLRGEWFTQLGTFRPAVRDPFANEYLLRALNEEEAREIIVEPARGQGVSYAPGLVDELVSDLGENEISPPQLQLVCSALYDELDGRDTITQAMYQDLGGTSGILLNHLDRVLKRSVPSEQRPAARKLLEALVTSEGQRALRTGHALARDLQALGIDLMAIDEVLAVLVDSRLLRVEEVEEEEQSVVAYELAHDYLVSNIELDPATQARKAAQEMLEREVVSFRRHGTLLGGAELAIIEARADELALSDDERALIEASRRRIARQRGVVFAGVGLVVVLVGVAILSVFASLRANATRVEAEAEKGTAQALTTLAFEEAAQAATRQAEAEIAADEADARAAVAAGQLSSLFGQTGTLVLSVEPDALAWVSSEDENKAGLWAAAVFNPVAYRIDLATGAVLTTVQIGGFPQALAWDGDNLWVAEAMDARLRRIDMVSGAELAQIELNSPSTALAWDGSDLWVTNPAGGTVERVDVETRTVQSSIDVGGSPYSLAWLPSEGDGKGSLWVGNLNNRTLQMVDVEVGDVVDVIDIGYGAKDLVWDGASLWVSNWEGHAVQQVDLESGVVVATVEVGDYVPAALAWDGASLWASNAEDHALQQVDVEAGAVVTEVDVGVAPGSLAWVASQDDDGGSLWAYSWESGTVLQVGVEEGALLNAIDPGFNANALAWGEASLWLLNQDDSTVYQIDLASRTAAPRFPVDRWVNALAWDGTGLWVAGEFDPTVRKYDVLSGVEMAAIEVGGAPVSLAWDGASLWVANAQAGTVHQIDVEARAVVAEVDIPDGFGPPELIWDGASLWVSSLFDIALQQIDVDVGAWVATVDLGGFSSPSVASDGASLWVANPVGGTVQQIDVETGTVLTEVVLGDSPQSLVWVPTEDGSGASLWVANGTGNAVQQINVRSLNRLLEARRASQ